MNPSASKQLLVCLYLVVKISYLKLGKHIKTHYIHFSGAELKYMHDLCFKTSKSDTHVKTKKLKTFDLKGIFFTNVKESKITHCKINIKCI